MNPMITRCRLPFPVQDASCINNVREKTFSNGSHFHGVSCYASPSQALGIPTDLLVLDEIQELNIEFIPQIRETLGTSDYRWEIMFGTARGMENTIQRIFEQTTMSEFSVKCEGCNHWNIPSVEHDALTMIQPHGIACTKCGKLLDVEKGKWIHAYPERKRTFIGWHVPQTIVKARIHPHDKYIDTIYNKLHGTNPYPQSKFLQEVMGISTEQGGTSITAKQVRKASVLDIGEDGSGIDHARYIGLSGGVDWGGSEIVSFTVGTVVGLTREGKFECIGATRPVGVPDNQRHFPVAHFFKKISSPIGLQSIGGDALFVGSVQNRNLQGVTGVPVAGIAYSALKSFHAAHQGGLFSVDRNTLLYVVYTMIKEGFLTMPKGEWFEKYSKDLMALYIEDMETPSGQSVRRYKRYETLPDDFTHALAYAVFALAMMNGIDLAGMVGLDPSGSVSASFLGEADIEDTIASRPDLFV
jgi:hypothetical protein